MAIKPVAPAASDGTAGIRGPGSLAVLRTSDHGAMARYALLIRPSGNRVYAESATALTLAELEVFSQSVLGSKLTERSTRC